MPNFALTESNIDEALGDLCHHGHGNGILYEFTAPSGQFVSFYFAYSTWNGRFLLIHEMEEMTKESWTILAKICVRLGCSRLAWRERQDGVPQGAIFMKGWLTVHWSQFDDYLKRQLGHTKIPSKKDIFITEANKALWQKQGLTFLVDSIRPSLEMLKSGALSVTLATEKDVPDILRLVQSLAEYEKEPDAVKNTEQDLLQDGFGEKRLYYCFMLQGEETCGMALFYLGPDFVYLEDLYVEDSARGNGGGTLLMSAMAMLASFMDYPRVVWQVLVSMAQGLAWSSVLHSCSRTGIHLP